MQSTVSKAVVAMAVIATLSSPVLSACSQEGAGDASGQGDAPGEALVRGAEPGGMTSQWESSDGQTQATLEDDGKAFYKSGGEKISGMWLMSSPTEGELMLNDGQSFRLTLDAESDALSVIDMSKGGESGTLVATLVRTGDGGGTPS